MVLKREVTKQFIRFCLIGLESTVLNYLVFLIMFYYLAINYLISAGTGFIAGVFLGFIFNKLYTFRSKKKVTQSLPMYFLVYLFTLLFTVVSLNFLVELTPLTPLISNAILLPITTLINFFGTKIIAFQNKRW